MSSPVVRSMERSGHDAQLFAAAFLKNGYQRSVESVSWQFFDNPVGKIFVDLAVAGPDELAAIYATLPGRFWVDGRTLTAVQSLDTLTDEAHRGKGLFKQLASSVFARCEKESVQFIYGFPNGSSAHGFFERLGWSRMDPVPFLIRPLRTRYFLERLSKSERISHLLPNIRLGRARIPSLPDADVVRPSLGFDTFDVDSIWESFAAGVGVCAVRDAAYLSWRFRKPAEHYKTLVYWRRGEAVGFVTYTIKEKHGGRIAYVMELMYRPGLEDVGGALLRHALREMLIRGVDAALAWCFEHSPNFSSFRRLGFLPMPERLRPIELHFGARVLHPSCPRSVLDRKSWYLSYCDSDTV